MGETIRSEAGRGTRRALAAVAVFGLGMVLLAATFAGARPALGVAAGAVLALANLWAFDLLVRRLLDPSTSKPLWAVAAGLKFCALVCGGFLILEWELLPLLPMAIGYGALPLGIVASTGRSQPAIREN
jgi:drug/metabolite transporter (DMT)-like permease